MKVTWSERAGSPCLRIEDETIAALRGPAAPSVESLARRITILPHDLLAANDRIAALQSLPGTFALGEDGLYFSPRFPFMEGVSYAVLLDHHHVATVERSARPSTAVTEVVSVFPSGSVLPVNALRLYVHFSSPMTEGWAQRAVRVSRADDREPLEGVFLEMTPELWDPARTRLTLLFDPGRIKRGLAPNLEAGYPLVEGHSIVVTVDAAFPDAAGRPLRGDVTRRYDVGPPVRTRVDPTTWRYQHPCCDSLDPLVVEFDRPLDRAILDHSLWVCEAAGEPLRGRTSVGAGERSWRFEPQRPWRRQNSYALVIDPRLEDLAGNSLRRIFDRDLSRAEDDPPPALATEVAFTCSGSVR